MSDLIHNYHYITSRKHSVDPSVFCYRFAFFLEKWYNYLIKNFGDDSEFRKLHAGFCLGKGL